MKNNTILQAAEEYAEVLNEEGNPIADFMAGAIWAKEYYSSRIDLLVADLTRLKEIIYQYELEITQTK